MGQAYCIDEVGGDSCRYHLFYWDFYERDHLCVLLPVNVPSSSYFLLIHENQFSAIKAAVKAEINFLTPPVGLLLYFCLAVFCYDTLCKCL